MALPIDIRNLNRGSNIYRGQISLIDIGKIVIDIVYTIDILIQKRSEYNTLHCIQICLYESALGCRAKLRILSNDFVCVH